jgi:UDP-N-acetylglucosamine 2-epimerase (non-hydrolysing)
MALAADYATPSPRPLRVLVAIGTRPEAIKLAPVVWELQSQPSRFETTVCVTGQHRELLDGALAELEIHADCDLRAMTPGQSGTDVAARVLERFSDVLRDSGPDVVVVQGDTTSALAAGLAAAYAAIPVAHVEAGLRTHDPTAPLPEEINRRLLAGLSAYHFAPTPGARENLLREGVASDRVWVCGNTSIDALRWVIGLGPKRASSSRREVIITMHRRESIPTGLAAVARGILALVDRYPDISFVWPQHPNPGVRLALSELRVERRPNLDLCPPMGYRDFVARLSAATLVLTDSGGIQEEAAALGVPALVAGEKTARQEGLDVGAALAIGTDSGRVVTEVSRLLDDPDARAAMITSAPLYGDGYAASRIVEVLAGETEWREAAG